METGFSSAIVLQAVAVWVIQQLKSAKWFPWLNQHTVTANRLMALFVSALTASGITWHWNATDGQFIVNGLVLATVLHGLWAWLTTMVVNELIYMGVQIKNQATSTGQTVGAGPMPVSTTAKTVTMDSPIIG